MEKAVLRRQTTVRWIQTTDFDSFFFSFSLDKFRVVNQNFMIHDILFLMCALFETNA